MACGNNTAVESRHGPRWHCRLLTPGCSSPPSSLQVPLSSLYTSFCFSFPFISTTHSLNLVAPRTFPHRQTSFLGKLLPPKHPGLSVFRLVFLSCPLGVLTHLTEGQSCLLWDSSHSPLLLVFFSLSLLSPGPV